PSVKPRSPTTQVRFLTLLTALAVGAYACTSALTTETTPADQATTTTGQPTTTSTRATTTTVAPPPEHRIQVRIVDGEGEFYDTETGETFVVRGTNYVFVQDSAGQWTSE